MGLVQDQWYYATVEATNHVGMVVAGYSDRIVLDNTAPLFGLVIELDGLHVINASDPSLTDTPVDCTTDEGRAVVRGYVRDVEI